MFVLPRTLPDGAGPQVLPGNRIKVNVTNPFSIVRFGHPPGMGYTYRFERTSRTSIDAGLDTTTRLIGVGDGGYFDPATSTFVTVEQIETVHVSGHSATEADSRKRSVELTHVLRTGIACTSFGAAQVCVPSPETTSPAPFSGSGADNTSR